MGDWAATEAFKKAVKDHKFPDSPELHEFKQILRLRDMEGYALLGAGVFLIPEAIRIAKGLWPRYAYASASLLWLGFGLSMYRCCSLSPRGRELLAKLNEGLEPDNGELESGKPAHYLYPTTADKTYVYGLGRLSGSKA